jgi:hypothetical protein
MYYALTTMATIGLGDYYPVSDVERSIGAFMMLFAATICSYCMGELMLMIEKVRNLNNDFSSEDKLDNFFILLRKYNYGNPLPKELNLEIVDHLKFIWNNDRISCLRLEEDLQRFSQLPVSC